MLINELTVLFKTLTEGVYDKNIFKAIFVIGGPGSGKSFIAKRIAERGGLRIIDLDQFVEMFVNKEPGKYKYPIDYDTAELEPLVDKSRRLKNKRKELLMNGRVGLVIDCTGRWFPSVEKHALELVDIGYQVAMVFVKADINVAKKRNVGRKRFVDPKFVEMSQEQIKFNIGKYKKEFIALAKKKGWPDNFFIVDNSKEINLNKNYPSNPEELASPPVLQRPAHIFLWNKIQKFLDAPVTSKIANDWITTELNKKKLQKVKLNHPFSWLAKKFKI